MITDNDEIVCVDFIYLPEAFDTVKDKIILKKSNHYETEVKNSDWFLTFLKNRKQ